MSGIPKPDHDQIMALFAQIGLDPEQVMQWPVCEPRRGSPVLVYETASGGKHTVTVDRRWARDYYQARGL